MGFLDFLFGGAKDPHAAIQRFEQEIQAQRDHLFGILLFAQGVELLYSDQPDVVQMNRASFQEIMDRGRIAISAAEVLLQEAKANPEKAKEIKRFTFPPTSGHPMIDEMTTRARILVRTYDRLFPGRPRSKELSRTEHEALMEAAANQL